MQSSEYIYKCLHEYEIEFSEKSYFSAYALLGEIHKIIGKSYSKKEFKDVVEKIEEALSQNKIVKDVTKQYEREFKRLENIIRTGKYFIYEEFIQIFTIRFQLFFINQLFFYKEVGLKNLVQMDLEIREIGCIEQNKTDYFSAIKKIRKNWIGVARDIELFMC